VKRTVTISVAPGGLLVQGLGRPKEVQLPEEVLKWASDPAVLTILEDILEDPGFRAHVTTSGALQSLVMLLYAMYIGVPPYKAAKSLGTSHERLYRLERGLKKEGLYYMIRSRLEILRALKGDIDVSR